MTEREDGLDGATEQAFERLRAVPPYNKGRQAAHRAVFVRQADDYRRLDAVASQPADDPERRTTSMQFPGSKRWAWVGAFAALVLVFALGLGGVIYAADGAVPGDPLYSLDQAFESARLSLTRKPESTITLLQSMAEERLQEAEALSSQGDTEHVAVALDGYDAAVASMAETLVAAGGAEPVAAVADLAGVRPARSNPAAGDPGASVEDRGASDAGEAGTTAPRLASRTTQAGDLPADVSSDSVSVASVPAPAQNVDDAAAPGGDTEGDVPDDGEDGDADTCVGVDPHPEGQALAEAYGVPYEDIMEWFCDGYGFGEIEHALKAAELTGLTPEEILAMKDDLGGWGEVWKELGLGGNDDGEGEDGDAEEGDSCVGVDPHPVGQKLADAYEVPYEEIMTWFCDDNFGFGEIKLALQAGEKLDMLPEDLLAMKDELGGWGQVWKELGYKGRPKDKDKDNQGAPGKDKDVGPDKEKKDKKEKPVKPEKPDKPDKPDKPEKPDKPDKPDKEK
jgi:hypothetical protein